MEGYTVSHLRGNWIVKESYDTLFSQEVDRFEKKNPAVKQARKLAKQQSHKGVQKLKVMNMDGSVSELTSYKNGEKL